MLAEIPVFMPAGADVYGFLDMGRQALSHPGEIYPAAAAEIAGGFVFVTLAPPPQILLATPFAVLPNPAGAVAWVAFNGLAAFLALAVLLRAIGLRRSYVHPVFWLVVICFTPLFEDIRLGQRGGVLLLLSVAAVAGVRSRPVAAGVLAGLATSLKFYPGAMVLGVAPLRERRFPVALLASSTVVLGLTFIPFGSPLFYLQKVLAPSLFWQQRGGHDCFQNSTQLLFARVVGGESFGVIGKSGNWSAVTLVPWHFQGLSTILTYVTMLLIVALTTWPRAEVVLPSPIRWPSASAWEPSFPARSSPINSCRCCPSS